MRDVHKTTDIDCNFYLSMKVTFGTEKVHASARPACESVLKTIPEGSDLLKMGWEEDRVSSGRDDLEQGSLNSITYLESTLYNKGTALMTSAISFSNVDPPQAYRASDF